jgi:hypothetical protein
MRFPALLVSVFVLSLFSTPAQAQSSRTWVASYGDDVNPCNRTSPCRTFVGAIIKTAEGGEINVVDPGAYGFLHISKSLTINGHNEFASTQAAFTNGFVVDVTTNPGTATVYLRDLVINGAQTGTDGIRYLAGANLVLDNVRIYGFADDGIEVSGAGTLNLKAKNVMIEDVAGDCVTMSTTTGQVVAMIDASTMRNCGAAGITAANRVRAGVRSTVISHTPFGVRTTGTDSVLNLENMMVSFCTTAGLRTTTAAAPGRIRVSNTHIAQNLVGVDFTTGGNIDSFQGNTFSGNPTGEAFSMTTPKQ